VRREAGFTFLEVIASLALIAGVSVVVGGLAVGAERSRGLGAAYALDVADARRALDAVERDLRAAHDVRVDGSTIVASTDAGDVAWSLDKTALRRDGVVLARNVAAFAARRDGDVVDVTITLGRRSPDAKKTASVATSVRMRAPREASK
jgi:type II secretory pathway pseudopilin PulG